MPPLPEQDNVKLLFPTPVIWTISVPAVVFVPDQLPEAEHEFAFDEDHERVTLLLINWLVGSAEKLIEGNGVVGV